MILQRASFSFSLATLGCMTMLMACAEPTKSNNPSDKTTEKPTIEEPGKGNSTPDPTPQEPGKGNSTPDKPTGAIDFTLNETKLTTDVGLYSVVDLTQETAQIVFTNGFTCQPIAQSTIVPQTAALILNLDKKNIEQLVNNPDKQDVTISLEDEGSGAELVFKPFGDDKSKQLCGDEQDFPSTTAKQGSVILKPLGNNSEIGVTFKDVVFADKTGQDVKFTDTTTSAKTCDQTSPLKEPVACAQ